MVYMGDFLMNDDRYEIDYLYNNQWKLLRYCRTLEEVVLAMRVFNEKNKTHLRVLDNNKVLEFVDGTEFGILNFEMKHVYKEDKCLEQYNYFVKPEEVKKLIKELK